MYQIVFILLLLFSLLEVFNNKRHAYIFYLLYGLMTFIATFRYGQHADYFAYLLYYDKPFLSIRDPGFMGIILFFRWLGVGKIAFSAIISFMTMALAYPFFKKTCRMSIIALLIFWSYCYITCSMCAIRQGLVLGIVLSAYAYYPKIVNRKGWIIYTIIVLVMATIHLSVLVTLIFPLITRINLKDNKWLTPFVIGFGAVTILAGSTFMTNFLPSFALERVYEADGESKVFQLILRIAILFSVLLIASSKNSSKDVENAKKIILFGFFFYGLFAFSGTTAGRIEYYSRMFVCLVAGVASLNKIRTKKVALGLMMIVAIHSALWVRNIDEEITRAHYREGINVANVPFISIFDKEQFDRNARGLNNQDVIMNNLDW